ncbi:MAG: DUF87 domain-containing protein [Anaerolineales bacterium]|jgi:hypothetical protein
MALDTKGKFYIGRSFDLKKAKTTSDMTLYDPEDLTTHGVVVGMTGSGKTGLCIDILEEAALQGIPALIVDPKGDISNLLLHFPDLSAADFEPWVDANEARHEKKTVEQMAGEVSELWKNGLATWDIQPERIQQVKDSVEYAVYTPGSDAGIPVDILASLKAPAMDWDDHRESLRQEISSTVTAILGLVGIQADPVKSREHILLSNIFEVAWEAGQDLDMAALINHIQSPPFEKLGALELDKFYPEDDRFELAMSLNNLLAAPAFQSWTEGAPLDIGTLLWTADGKPRHSVFYLAHLPEAERMFFVTLLLTAVEAWMRTQGGTHALKALLYFDETIGFLPPVEKPPSKEPMIRLLKQARAFGLGLLLTTQNPVDLDYKALSNAGTWFIGKLQTEQDKARLLDGLEGVEAGESGFARKEIDKLISDLGKRVFLLHNVHDKGPQVFQTRWAMAYLKGPITRDQLGPLNEWVGASVTYTTDVKAAPASTASDEEISSSKPAVPDGVQELFLPNNLTVAEALKLAGREAPQSAVEGLVYYPVLFGQAEVRYSDRKRNIDHDASVAVLDPEPTAKGVARWDEITTPPLVLNDLDRAPAPEAQFATAAGLLDSKTFRAMEKDFVDYIYRQEALELAFNPELDLVAEPGMSTAEFRSQCAEAAREKREEEADALKTKYEKKIDSIRKKLEREERELAEDQAELSSRKMEEMATHAENVLGLFTGSRSTRRISTSMTKRRMTAKAKADVEESEDAIEAFKAELADLEAEAAEELQELNDKWAEAATQIEDFKLNPLKKNIFVEAFGLAWMPYWRLLINERPLEVPAFSAEG